MNDDGRVIEIGPKLAVHFSTLSDLELVDASGLGLPQPDQYQAQHRTMQVWKKYATAGYNKDQKVAYVNIPVLAIAELLRRSGVDPTIENTVSEIVRRGFLPKNATWSGPKLRKEIQGYVLSAAKRGLCRLR